MKWIAAFLFALLLFFAACREKQMPAERMITKTAEAPPPKLPGKFPGDMDTLLHRLLPADDTLYYTQPDSGNTRIFLLSADTSEIYLIDTWAGMPGGSCGDEIMVVRLNGNSLDMLLHECGRVDTVLELSHNGVHDFAVWYRSETYPQFYRFNGKTIVECDSPMPPEPYRLIRAAIENANPDDPYYPWEDSVKIRYLQLGASVYVLADHMYKTYLIRENSTTKYEVINTFEDVCGFDIEESKTRGMSDLRILEGMLTWKHYKWNGKKYVPGRSDSVMEMWAKKYGPE